MSRKTPAWLSPVLIAAIVAVCLLSFGGFKAQAKSYGKPINSKQAQKVELATLFTDQAPYGKTIIVEGKIGQACQVSGCWLTLTDGQYQLFVQFYDFTVFLKPGVKARIQGELRKRNQAPYLAGTGLEIIKKR